MSIVKVEADKLFSISKSIDMAIDDYENGYKKLLEEIKSIAKWRGQDCDTFKTHTLKFEDDLAKMVELLKAYSNYIKNCANEYKDAQNLFIAQARRL